MAQLILLDVKTINGWIIKKRKGKRNNLPLYVVYTPDGRCMEEFRRLASAENWCRNNYDNTLEFMWREFGNIPIDYDECIEVAFYHFPVGTNKFDIWKWFDLHHSTGVVSLQTSKLYQT